jgi:hypothetical protein
MLAWLQGCAYPLWPMWFSVYASPPLFAFCSSRNRLQRSAGHATLDTGGWLDLARQGLSPCKMRQASLAALTYKAMERGRGDFPSLDETEQIALLTLAEMADPGSIEQLFFSCLRNRAFYHYYASPSAFNIPGYHTSPQPVGYPGHSKPITEQP